MDALLSALLVAAISLTVGLLTIRMCLGVLAQHSQGCPPPIAPTAHWQALRDLKLPDDRELEFVHSEHTVEGAGDSRRQVTRMTSYTVRARDGESATPVELLPVSAEPSQQAHRVQRAYEVHDVPARWKTEARSPVQRESRTTRLIAQSTPRQHWLA